MSVSLNDMMISERSKMAELNHGLLEKINSFFATISISDATIRRYYNTDGETMFEALQKDLNYFRVNVPDNLERIRDLKQNNELNPEQKKKLDDSENLAKDTLEMLDDTENIIKNIMEKRLNPAIMARLEDLAREKVMEYKIPPGNDIESAVLYEEYGGFRNRKNKTNNKKYTKKRTYKTPKKRVSKKNKTRKMKKNYL
jgi:hypothetical protein